MALTMAEAAKLSNDVLLTGVVETIIKDSPILSAAKRRVLGLALEYATGDRALYRQRITLGAV